MTDSPLEPLDLLDTDYADILAHSSHPPFELQLVRWINPSEARIKTNFLTLVRQKPKTPEQWATLTEAWFVACEYKPIDYPYRPSVDVFFKSLAQYWNRKETPVLLTGMGQDGAEGLSLLRSRGWHTIAQDEKSSVIYGMPKAAVQLNAAVEVLPPEAIVDRLVQRIMFNLPQ